MSVRVTHLACVCAGVCVKVAGVLVVNAGAIDARHAGGALAVGDGGDHRLLEGSRQRVLFNETLYHEAGLHKKTVILFSYILLDRIKPLHS